MIPIITKSDYKKIIQTVYDLLPNQKTDEVKQLIEELAKAEIVPDDNIEGDIIKINSEVEIEVVNSNKKIHFVLTLPSDSNIKQQKVSIISGMGVALIGFRQGMEVEWKLPGGLMKFKILKVINPN